MSFLTYNIEIQKRIKEEGSNAIDPEYIHGLAKALDIVKECYKEYESNCYTIKDFCEEHPYGIYVLATGDHSVAAIDGSYYDSFDSGSLTPIFYYERRI